MWKALIQPRHTVAIYMGLRNALTRAFVMRGASPDLPAAIVDNAARANQQVVVARLGTLADQARAASLRGPSIVIVDTVVSMRGKLHWCAPGERRGARAGSTGPKRCSGQVRARNLANSVEVKGCDDFAQGNRLKIRVTNGRRAESVVIL